VRAVAPVGPPHAGGPGAAALAVLLAAAATTTGTVLIRDWPPSGSTEHLARHVLAGMGAYVVRSAAGLTVTGRSTSGELRGIDVDLSDAPELLPVVTTMAAVATSPSAIRAASSGERLLLVAAGVRRLGGDTRVDGDVVRVFPRPLHGGTWHTGGDPYVALAGAHAGLAATGVVLVDDMACVDGVFPHFRSVWHHMLHADEHMLPGSEPDRRR
jgi:5-enolpyruvylshikimate-3-phosphate synthase